MSSQDILRRAEDEGVFPQRRNLVFRGMLPVIDDYVECRHLLLETPPKEPVGLITDKDTDTFFLVSLAGLLISTP